jgi:hypothetical protein
VLDILADPFQSKLLVQNAEVSSRTRRTSWQHVSTREEAEDAETIFHGNYNHMVRKHELPEVRRMHVIGAFIKKTAAVKPHKDRMCAIFILPYRREKNIKVQAIFANDCGVCNLPSDA